MTSASGWPVAIGRAAVPSPEQLIEMGLWPAAPEPGDDGSGKTPAAGPAVRTPPLAAGLVVAAGLVLAGFCGLTVLMPADAAVGIQAVDAPRNNLVMPAPLPLRSSPTASSTRTAPAAGAGASGTAGGKGTTYTGYPGSTGSTRRGAGNGGAGRQVSGGSSVTSPATLPSPAPSPTTAPARSPTAPASSPAVPDTSPAAVPSSPASAPTSPAPAAGPALTNAPAVDATATTSPSS